MSEPRFLDYDKSLACIHCGLCLSSCPTYLETGDENDSPRGRIYLMRALQDGRLRLSSDHGPSPGRSAVSHIDLCLGCRACEAVCPSGVRYGELLEGTRDHIEKQYRRPLWQRFLRRIAIEKIFPHPNRMKLAVWPAMLLQRLGAVKILPRFLRETFDLLPPQLSVADIPEVSEHASAEARGRLGFISGCVMSVLFGSTNAASIRLLNQEGYDVLTPEHQVCCGALFAHSGQLEKARDCARQNIEAFEKLNLDFIIINAAGCGSTLKEYGHLLAHDPAWAERAKAFSSKVRDLTEFLASMTGQPSAPDQTGAVVTVHDACHLAHAQRITKAPRDLVKLHAGARFVELSEADVCCGSAGSYNLTEPAMAERLQRRKVENIVKSGAQIVVTTNPGCILQIRAGLKKAGRPDIEVLHIADYLERTSRSAGVGARPEGPRSNVL